MNKLAVKTTFSKLLPDETSSGSMEITGDLQNPVIKGILQAFWTFVHEAYWQDSPTFVAGEYTLTKLHIEEYALYDVIEYEDIVQKLIEVLNPEQVIINENTSQRYYGTHGSIFCEEKREDTTTKTWEILFK